MALLRSLSGRLLLVTIIVVMLTEVAIFVPSVARFRQDYLLERVRRAEIAALTVLASPNRIVGKDLERALLERAEIFNVAVHHDGMREMVLATPNLDPVVERYDLREPATVDLIVHALSRLVSDQEGLILVEAFAPTDMGRVIVVTIDAIPLRDAIRKYGLNILLLSLVIALIAAVMVFFAMRRLVVRPITEVIENVKGFSNNPEDESWIIEPKSRVGEISDAQRAVAEMEREVQSALRSKARLASLGEAVAKISHDLRNILSTTQLMADRIESSQDPVVARTAPKLIRSLDRAIQLCQSTLTFGRAEEAPPEVKIVALADLTEDVVEGLGLLMDDQSVSVTVEIDAEAQVLADPEHLYRVLNNLLRNAAEAIRGSGSAGSIVISGETAAENMAIFVVDTGPGMPAQALEHLFQPFRGGARRGGTGLGLAIAQDLIQRNRGALELVASTTSGTKFRIVLPRPSS